MWWSDCGGDRPEVFWFQGAGIALAGHHLFSGGNSDRLILSAQVPDAKYCWCVGPLRIQCKVGGIIVGTLSRRCASSWNTSTYQLTPKYARL